MEMAMAEKSIGEDLLVIAGDNLFEFDLKRFVGFAAGHRDGVTVALYDIGNPVAARRFGVVGLDRDGRIIDFEEKPERPKSTLVSTGVYFFPKEKLPLIKEYVSVQDDKLDAPGYCIGWLSKTDRVYGFTFSEDWCDIGDIESYREQDKKYRERGDLKDDEK
jgi:glucose-1-phosphate thymidylyltransferase